MLKDMKTTEEIIQEILDEQHECRWMDTSDLEVYLRKVANEQKAIDHSEEHLAWIIKQYYKWAYEIHHCDNNEQCTFKEWIDKKIEEE